MQVEAIMSAGYNLLQTSMIVSFGLNGIIHFNGITLKTVINSE